MIRICLKIGEKGYNDKEFEKMQRLEFCQTAEAYHRKEELTGIKKKDRMILCN